MDQHFEARMGSDAEFGTRPEKRRELTRHNDFDDRGAGIDARQIERQGVIRLELEPLRRTFDDQIVARRVRACGNFNRLAEPRLQLCGQFDRAVGAAVVDREMSDAAQRQCCRDRLPSFAGPDDEHAPSRHRDAEMIESLDEAGTVEQRAVLTKAYRFDGTGKLCHRVALAHKRGHPGLVRDRHPDAANVLRVKCARHEIGETRGGHLHRHQHGIHTMTLEQMVVHFGRARSCDGIANDEEDLCRAGNRHWLGRKMLIRRR